MSPSKKVIVSFAFVAAGLALLCGWIAYRTWTRKLPASAQLKVAKVFVRDGELGIALPTEVLAAEVGDYERPAEEYLNLDFLRGRREIEPSHVLACDGPGMPPGRFRIFLQVENNVLTSIPQLDALIYEKLIPKFTLYSWSNEDLKVCRDQSAHFDAVFRSSVVLRLHQIPDKLLIAPTADFLAFKSATDLRVLGRREPMPLPLSYVHARELAEDILIVSRFYSLPLDYFLGIGAMENNYMSVRGDLDHAVWKRRRQRGDIVLRRRHGRVLVRNYSLGVWQITRETLRYAEFLYVRDRRTRDYGALPERLQPVLSPDPDDIRPESLTTYAGLLFRNLLDLFGGDVTKAVGAYNGGPRDPNMAYADSVRLVGQYARRVIVHAVFIDSKRMAYPAVIPRHQCSEGFLGGNQRDRKGRNFQGSQYDPDR